MMLQEVSVPSCTAGEEKLAGEPGGRKDWSRRQAERAAETPPATAPAEIKRQSRESRWGGCQCQKQMGKKGI